VYGKNAFPSKKIKNELPGEKNYLMWLIYRKKINLILVAHSSIPNYSNKK